MQNQDELHLKWIVLNVKIAAKCVNYKNKFLSTKEYLKEIVSVPASFTSLNNLKQQIQLTYLHEGNTIPRKAKWAKNNNTIIPESYQIDIDQLHIANDISKISTYFSPCKKSHAKSEKWTARETITTRIKTKWK